MKQKENGQKLQTIRVNKQVLNAICNARQQLIQGKNSTAKLSHHQTEKYLRIASIHWVHSANLPTPVPTNPAQT